MARAKAILKRRKAVTNIKKITRTMQLIATAKFQKCLARATATKPYTEKITQLVQHLSEHVQDLKHPLLETNTESGMRVVLVITSNRGLCGSYNAQVLRKALEFMGTGQQVELDASGKKGVNYFRFLGRPVHNKYVSFDDRVRFDQVQVLADAFMDRYVRKQIDSVHVVYMKFESASRQIPTVVQLLPLQQEPVEVAESTATRNSRKVQLHYEFSPEPAALLAELLPATVRMRLFQCFTDSIVSEQIARMVAMKAATDAAGDMIKSLTRTYNRARQTQITMELLDILGGVEALK